MTEVLHRYCRGMDRMDKELTRACWHADGTDDHAPLYVGTADGFLDWLWPVHAAMVLTRHRITNVLIDIRDGSAGVESYWEVTLRSETDGRAVDVRSGGRYVDDFEQRDGRWAIVHRRSIREWSRADPVIDLVDPAQGQAGIIANNPEARVTLPRRDRRDYSYEVLGL
ncbi:nuclear transport factor 2 family protein [Nocardia flavorosea]|uniref:nuclear transport factor 2 family protein n=1 Tax=Nocardia flavorosea TaxID=53429 RepID=UPI0024545E15|nr:nuclear transport factor 2 family protein [Nocardia flavorosea]